MNLTLFSYSFILTLWQWSWYRKESLGSQSKSLSPWINSIFCSQDLPGCYCLSDWHMQVKKALHSLDHLKTATSMAAVWWKSFHNFPLYPENSIIFTIQRRFFSLPERSEVHFFLKTKDQKQSLSSVGMEYSGGLRGHLDHLSLQNLLALVLHPPRPSSDWLSTMEELICF